jgi:hypothetical protein
MELNIINVFFKEQLGRLSKYRGRVAEKIRIMPSPPGEGAEIFRQSFAQGLVIVSIRDLPGLF